MELTPDSREFLECLNANKVQFPIIRVLESTNAGVPSSSTLKS